MPSTLEAYAQGPQHPASAVFPCSPCHIGRNVRARLEGLHQHRGLDQGVQRDREGHAGWGEKKGGRREGGKGGGWHGARATELEGRPFPCACPASGRSVLGQPHCLSPAGCTLPSHPRTRAAEVVVEGVEVGGLARQVHLRECNRSCTLGKGCTSTGRQARYSNRSAQQCACLLLEAATAAG